MLATSFRFAALVLTGALLLPGSAFAAQPKPGATPAGPTEAELTALAESLKPKTGAILLGGGIAALNVPDSFGYLDAKQTHTVLEKIWGNPPGTDALGMLVPKGFNPFSESSWAVTIRFEPEGYVKDDDAEKIDYAAVLKEMQEASKAANEERVKQGYAPVQLVGWATPPRYDKAAKKIYWARELKFSGSPVNTLNYNIRILGRRGYLVLNAIGSMQQLQLIEAAAPQLLSMVDFNPGHRYADFNAASDKVAEYGLAGLVAGGVAAKLGFFKWIWLFLLSAKKLLIALVIMVGAGLMKLISMLTNGRQRRIGEGAETGKE